MMRAVVILLACFSGCAVDGNGPTAMHRAQWAEQDRQYRESQADWEAARRQRIAEARARVAASCATNECTANPAQCHACRESCEAESGIWRGCPPPETLCEEPRAACTHSDQQCDDCFTRCAINDGTWPTCPIVKPARTGPRIRIPDRRNERGPSIRPSR